MPSDGILHDLPRYGLDLFTDEAKVVKADDSLTAQHVDWEPHWSELLPIFFEIVDVRDVWTAQETKSPIFVCVDSVELQISQAQSLIATWLPLLLTISTIPDNSGLIFLHVGQD